MRSGAMVLLSWLLAVLPAGSARAACGDDVVDPGESCDDGNLVDGDGCSSECDLCLGDDASGDADGDGWCAQDDQGQPVDCADDDPDRHPWALEQCNGLDDDCNGVAHESEADEDGDGWRICHGDCDDRNPRVSPEAEEICNQIDDDCDRRVDPDCGPTLGGGGCEGPALSLLLLPLGPWRRWRRGGGSCWSRGPGACCARLGV